MTTVYRPTLHTRPAAAAAPFGPARSPARKSLTMENAKAAKVKAPVSTNIQVELAQVGMREAHRMEEAIDTCAGNRGQSDSLARKDIYADETRQAAIEQ